MVSSLAGATGTAGTARGTAGRRDAVPGGCATSDGDEGAGGAFHRGDGAVGDDSLRGGDEVGGSGGTTCASTTLVGKEAAGIGIAAASATIGCGGAGSDGVAGDGASVGSTTGASASIGRGAAGGDGGISGACSPLGAPCVELPSGRAGPKSAAMYRPQVVA